MSDADRERRATGEYVETIPPDHVLDAVRRHPDPTVSAREVAEMLDCSTDAARNKLVILHERGAIERKKVGGRAVVWWLADDTTDHPDQPARDPAAIIDDLEMFLADREAPTPPAVDAVHDDYHARRHREQLERLATDGA